MSDDWEDSDESCPKCQQQMAWRDCAQCEDGQVEDDDGINGRTFARCETCNGAGYMEWCRVCGWDNVDHRFRRPVDGREIALRCNTDSPLYCRPCQLADHSGHLDGVCIHDNSFNSDCRCEHR